MQCIDGFVFVLAVLGRAARTKPLAAALASVRYVVVPELAPAQPALLAFEGPRALDADLSPGVDLAAAVYCRACFGTGL